MCKYTTDNLQPIVILDKNDIGGFWGVFHSATKEIISSYKINNFPWPRTQMELNKNVNSIIFHLLETKLEKKIINGF